MLKKKQDKVQMKHQEEMMRKMKQEAYKEPSVHAKKFEDKIESKLLVETKAMADKKRDKFDPKKDGPGRDAMTMGGNVLGHNMRSMPGWRNGV